MTTETPDATTYGASTYEWTVIEEADGTYTLIHPDSEGETCESLEEATDAVVVAMRDTADELSIHHGDRVSSGLLYAEADDIEAGQS